MSSTAKFSVPGLLGHFDSSNVLKQSVPGILGGMSFDTEAGVVVNATLSFQQTLTGSLVVVAILNATLGDFTSTAVAQNGDTIHFVVDATLGNFVCSSTFDYSSNFVLDATLGDFTLSTNVSIPIFYSANATLEIIPYLRLVLNPYHTVALDPLHDPIWVAVEFDLFDDTTAITVRVGNRGTIKRTVSGTLYQFEPRLVNLPIQLGTTINVTQYGSPVRAQPNGGLIQFALDESIWPWLEYRWIGQVFRVYTGQSTDPVQTDVDDDLTLVYQGRIANVKHDTLTISVETTDESLEWDDPLVTDFFDDTFPTSLQGKPKPQLWGTAFNIEPQIIDEATQEYAVSYRTGGLDYVNEVRIGNIPWNLNSSGPPGAGEWTPTSIGFNLGSPPLGFDVRCDAKQGIFTVGGLLQKFVEDVGGTIDDSYIGPLNVAMPMPIGYATGISPINRLDAIDDFVNNSGCWWGVGPLAKAIGGVIESPNITGTTLVDDTKIKSLNLSAIHPPAWRIRVGYQRNVNPTTNSAPAVLQTEQSIWAEKGRVYEPHYENTTIRDVDPKAVDVPLLDGLFTFSTNVAPVQQRLSTAWGTVRHLFDIETFIPIANIRLYDTIAVDYMMVQANLRITSAIIPIGLGPATLQLWGTVGTFSGVAPPFGSSPPPSSLPQEVMEVGTWTRNSGSGTFVVGTDCPSTVTSLWVRGVGAGGGGASHALASGFQQFGGGGGAGGYFEDTITVTAGQSLSWSVGTGGAGKAGNTTGQADSGGNTSFSSMTAFGGEGGSCIPGTSLNGGAGGGASGASVIAFGGSGGVGYAEDVTAYNVDVYTANGGGSAFGGGKHASNSNDGFVSAPGSGGGGHATTSSNAATSGENGMIIVIWFVNG